MEKDTRKYNNLHKFYIAGVQHHQMHKVIKEMEVGNFLNLTPEPSNKFDSNAVRIEYSTFNESIMCGYVPKKFSAEISAYHEMGGELQCIVTELDKNAKPWEQCMVEIREVVHG